MGISNVDIELYKPFREYFLKFFPQERIKFNRNHLFVNSRPLLREFIAAKQKISEMSGEKIISAYFAGRFDGDGSIDKDMRKDCRIVYGKRDEAETDKILLEKIGIANTKIYFYKSANTFCLYVSRFESKNFLNKILPYSIKLQKLVSVPRRDLVSA